MKVGVLALQGDFLEHQRMLRSLGVDAPAIRTPRELDGVDGLVIPGGESTTIGKLMVRYGLDQAIPSRVREGMPVFGTCAGMILLARAAEGGEPPLLRLMDITVRRNAYGRQVNSFEVDLEVPALGPPTLRAIFIRAPIIEEYGPRVKILAVLNDHPVFAQEGNILVSGFHPELVPDDRVHRYFLEMVKSQV